MKKIVLILTFISTQVFAAVKQEIITEEVFVSVNELTCVSRPFGGSFALLSFDGRPLNSLIPGPDNLIELSHKVVTSWAACDLAQLKNIYNEATPLFIKYARASIKVTKQTGESFLNSSKKCIAHFRELVELDLKHGLELSSFETEVRRANDCP